MIYKDNSFFEKNEEKDTHSVDKHPCKECGQTISISKVQQIHNHNVSFENGQLVDIGKKLLNGLDYIIKDHQINIESNSSSKKKCLICNVIYCKSDIHHCQNLLKGFINLKIIPKVFFSLKDSCKYKKKNDSNKCKIIIKRINLSKLIKKNCGKKTIDN